jgi:hypothetical protein
MPLATLSTQQLDLVVGGGDLYRVPNVPGTAYEARSLGPYGITYQGGRIVPPESDKPNATIICGEPHAPSGPDAASGALEATCLIYPTPPAKTTLR